MGTIITAIEERLATEKYKRQKAYLVALASCIREVEPGSDKHREILWVIKHQDRIRKCRKLIEQIEVLEP